MCDLIHTGACDVEVLPLDLSDNLGKITGSETLAAVCRQESSLQIIEGEVAVRTTMRVLRTRLILSEDLLTADGL